MSRPRNWATALHGEPFAIPARALDRHRPWEDLRDHQRVDSFWHCLKVLLRTHTTVAYEHLPLYLAEAMWHHNHLEMDVLDQMAQVIRNMDGLRIPRADLRARVRPCEGRRGGGAPTPSGVVSPPEHPLAA